MKKMSRITSIIICIVMALMLSGCSSSVSGITDGKRIISAAIGHPEGHPQLIALYAFRDYIEENLGDKFQVNIFPNGLMGGNAEAQELLQLGTLDLVVTSGSNMEAFSNKYKIFGIPYLFNDEASFRKVMNDEEFTKEIYNSTVDKGIQGVAWFANGVNNFYSPNKIETPEDLKGLKIRVQSSEANVKMVQAFDAAAVLLAYSEVYTALQNRVIDAGTNPETALVSMKHGEVAKYYSRTEHQIFTDMMIASTKFLNSLSEEEREIVQKGFEICTQVANEEWDRQATENIEKAKEMGVEFVIVDKEPFKELQKPVRDELLKSYPELQPLYDKIQKIQN